MIGNKQEIYKGDHMRREVSLEEISDGKLYGIHDMAKADCQECEGCSACCQGMGNSIVLDPLDIWLLKTHLGLSFEELMKSQIELNVVDHVILPNLKMNIETNKCNFLDANGRCSIHAFRPGICRIFPLGRVYENQSFRYFLQVKECMKTNRSKIKVSKWIDCKQVKANQEFIGSWHYLLKDVEKLILASEEEDALKNTSMYLLNLFYVQTVEEEQEFYIEMSGKIKQARTELGIEES